MNQDEARIRHNEAARKYVQNHPEKRRESANSYWKRQKAKDPEAWKAQMDEKTKLYRSQHLEECKKRSREASKRRRDKNRDKYNAEQREYRKNNPGKVKQYYLKRRPEARLWARNRLLAKYGLTQENYQQRLIDQAGKCALCDEIMTVPHIDHCHKTGKVRKLLCSYCNTSLGYIEKRIEKKSDILERIVEYLKY